MPTWKERAAGKTYPEKVTIYKRGMLSYLYESSHPVTKAQIAKYMGFAIFGGLLVESYRQLEAEGLVIDGGEGRTSQVSITEKGEKDHEKYYKIFKEPLPTGASGPFHEVFPKVFKALQLKYPEISDAAQANLYVKAVETHHVQICYNKMKNFEVMNPEKLSAYVECLKRFYAPLYGLKISHEVMDGISQKPIPVESGDGVSEEQVPPFTPLGVRILSMVKSVVGKDLAYMSKIGFETKHCWITIKRKPNNAQKPL